MASPVHVWHANSENTGNIIFGLKKKFMFKVNDSFLLLSCQCNFLELVLVGNVHHSSCKHVNGLDFCYNIWD